MDDGAVSIAKIIEQGEDEERRLRWPRRPNFRSVLAIGYKKQDAFRWHTDMAGDDGWVCSISVGSRATFEYLPLTAPSALRRARAMADEEVVRVEIDSGDAVLFNGGLLPHRLASVAPSADGAAAAAIQKQMAPYVRMNMQVRVYGAGDEYGLHEMLAKGYDYIH